MHLGELADVICGPFGSAITNKDYQESGIPLIRITNISGDGYMDYSDIRIRQQPVTNSSFSRRYCYFSTRFFGTVRYC